MKKCSRCKEKKGRRFFHKNKSTKDGLVDYCKACIQLRYYEKHDYHKARFRKRYERNKERWIVYAATQKIKFPEKYEARHTLRNHVKMGKVSKPKKCEICDKENQRIEGHHKDYSKPLDVIWACPQCHANIHKEP